MNEHDNTANTPGSGAQRTEIATLAVAAGKTIAADLGADDVLAASGANNLIVSSDAAITLPGDTLATDPLLMPLAVNGGPTRTHALPATSCARDANGSSSSFQWDQRGPGHPRLVGSAVDIGAYEYDPVDADRIFTNGFD